MFDIIVIGAGPAGMTAAIYARRAAKTVLVLEAMSYGGQIINTPEIENYPAAAHISGFDFAAGVYNQAKELGADYFTTTLTISPLKNAALLNQIGEEEAAKHGVSWLPSDFKKREGYKRSIQLSAQYDLYRQNYCGCIFSKPG